MIPVGLELVLVVGAEAGAEADRGARLERLGLLEEEEVVVVVEQEDHGGGDADRRMGSALETLGRGGTVADLGHYDPGRAEKLRALMKRSLDVPRMDGKARGQERWLPGWGQRYPHLNTWCGRRLASA